MTITLRTTKGSALSFNEMDNNFRETLDLRRAFIDQVTTGGTADAMTADFSATVSLVNGVLVKVRIAATNTISGPTIDVNATGPRTITRLDGIPIPIGGLPSGAIVLLSYDSAFDSWVAINSGAVDALTLNGEVGSFYTDWNNLINIPTPTDTVVAPVRRATEAEALAGTETDAFLSPATGVTKPVFITPVTIDSEGVGDNNGAGAWISYNVLALAGAPASATIVLLEWEARMERPDGSGQYTEILHRAEPSGAEYNIGRGASSSGQDRVAWAGQGFYPMADDGTAEYFVTTAGFDLGWALRIVGYW